MHHEEHLTHHNEASTTTQALAVVGVVTLGAIIIPMVLLIATSIPDIIRYIRIHNM